MWQAAQKGLVPMAAFIIIIIIIIADSYVAGADREAGSAAEFAAARKEDKIIDGRYLFEPIAIETL